jgi:ABC-type transporter Mla maintaining outer membrane lipid asymmetry permease subunit MlaE
MKKNSFRTKTFIAATIIIVLLTFATSIFAFAGGEGTGNVITTIFSKLFMLLRFPTHTLFWTTFNHEPLFAWGLLFNSVFYGLIIERVISLIRHSN